MASTLPAAPVRSRRAAGHTALALLRVLPLLAWPQRGARADERPDWQLWHSDEATGTQVWLRARSAEVPGFRAVTRLQSRLSALVARLLDTDRRPVGVYHAGEVRRLDGDGPTAGVAQVITAMPWPLRDREAIVRCRLDQDAACGEVTLQGQAAPGRLPPADGLVRMPSLTSTWRLLPLAGGEVEVRFEGHGDPGGNLALPLLRLFVDAAVWHAPLQTVNALREMVARPAYRDAVLPFIREPAP